jgi:hypothetical protein
MRQLVVVRTDCHGGHCLGALNPDTILWRLDYEGNAEPWTPDLCGVQEKLWQFQREDLARIKDLAGNDPIILIDLGDQTQGTRFTSAIIPGTCQDDQTEIACWNLVPFLKMGVKALRFCTGTHVHVPDSSEARIAARLKNNWDVDIRVMHHGRVTFGQEILDLTHHGPHGGSRDWLHGNISTYALKDRIYRDRRAGKQPARVYLRGHRHVFRWVTVHDTWDGVTTTHDLITVPSQCGFGDHARKVTEADPIIQNGLIVLEFVDGKLVKIHDFVRETDLRTEECL